LKREDSALNTRQYWIGFNHVAGVGPQRLKLLLKHFQSLEAAWHAPEAALKHAGLDRRTIRNLVEARHALDLAAIQMQLDQAGSCVLTLEDQEYPPVLKELPDAPPVLYLKGTLTHDDNWAIGIVGTRKASTYGRDTAYQLAYELAQQGLTIVSGLALGIDAAAHRGALDAPQGRSIAVLPCGIDGLYPPEHRKLAREIMDRGALVTEFPPGTQAEGKNFAPRNRIISGLSLGIIVVEAPEKSGALLTADSAAEQGREVFAVPGQTSSASSRGSNRLIQDGAKLVMSVDDVLTELNLTRDTTKDRTEVKKIAPETSEEAIIWQQLGDEAVHIDEICRATGLPVATVSSTLTIMELKGFVRQVGTMLYTRQTGPSAPFSLD
jgi:DNA processing protein